MRAVAGTLADVTALDAPPATERLVTPRFLVVGGATLLFFTYIGVMIPLIPRLIEDELGGGEFDIGLNFAIFSIAAIAVRPVLATFAERFGLRMMMAAGALLAAAASLVIIGIDSVWWMLPVRGVQGIGEAALFVGGASLINGFAPPTRRAEAASYFSVAVFGGIGLGPIIGETVIGDDRFAAGLIVAAVFALIAAALAMCIPSTSDDRPPAPKGNRFHRAALRPGAVLGLGIAGFATFNAFMPKHAEDVGLSGSQWVFAVYSIVCLVIRLVGAKWPERIGLARSTTIALSGVGLGLAVLWAVPTIIGVFAGTFVMAFGMAFMYPALMAMTVNSVPDDERVAVISTFTMFFEVGSAAGGIVLGLVAELTSKRGGFLGGAISCALGLWVLWRMLLPWVQQRSRSLTLVSESR
jgi:MFS family permease